MLIIMSRLHCSSHAKNLGVIAGMVDSSLTVGAVLEKKLQPLPFSFALSGSMNHNKNQFRIGCGFIIG